MEYPTSHLHFLGIHASLKASVYTGDEWDMEFHETERALYNYFIQCNRKYSGQHNQCIRAVHDGKVGCNIVECTKAFWCVMIGCMFFMV